MWGVVECCVCLGQLNGEGAGREGGGTAGGSGGQIALVVALKEFCDGERPDGGRGEEWGQGRASAYLCGARAFTRPLFVHILLGQCPSPATE